jgi:hypothetical protein
MNICFGQWYNKFKEECVRITGYELDFVYRQFSDDDDIRNLMRYYSKGYNPTEAAEWFTESWVKEI